MRSQANTAKLIEGNPTLMRLRELEVLEKVAGSGKLNVVLGETRPSGPRRSPRAHVKLDKNGAAIQAPD